nr:MAG: hypothetical protein AM324_01575 [Candidatus Thorarchaeota archaeon SMTZ1-83]
MKQIPLPINVGSQTQKVSPKFTQEVNVFSSAHQVQQSHEPFAKPSFDSLAASFFSLADLRMSENQKLVLRVSAELLKHNDLTVTALADLVSRRTTVPYSTAKWNLRSLISMGLLTGGDMENKGQPARLTSAALMLADFLSSRAD